MAAMPDRPDQVTDITCCYEFQRLVGERTDRPYVQI
jgi:hypothetical protein